MKNGLTLSIEYKLSNYCLKDLSCIGLPLSLLLHTFYVIDTELNAERETHITGQWQTSMRHIKWNVSIKMNSPFLYQNEKTKQTNENREENQ